MECIRALVRLKADPFSMLEETFAPIHFAAIGGCGGRGGGLTEARSVGGRIPGRGRARGVGGAVRRALRLAMGRWSWAVSVQAKRVVPSVAGEGVDLSLILILRHRTV